jgi:hypothetical protein
VRGAIGVVDVGAARGVGEVVGATWGEVEVMGIAQGAAEGGEAGGDEAAKCLAV